MASINNTHTHARARPCLSAFKWGPSSLVPAVCQIYLAWGRSDSINAGESECGKGLIYLSSLLIKPHTASQTDHKSHGENDPERGAIIDRNRYECARARTHARAALGSASM